MLNILNQELNEKQHLHRALCASKKTCAAESSFVTIIRKSEVLRELVEEKYIILRAGKKAELHCLE
jgi:hypothetical protein